MTITELRNALQDTNSKEAGKILYDLYDKNEIASDLFLLCHPLILQWDLYDELYNLYKAEQEGQK